MYWSIMRLQTNYLEAQGRTVIIVNLNLTLLGSFASFQFESFLFTVHYAFEIV